MVDLVIRGGTVVDGTGAEAFRADIGIAGDRIVSIAPEIVTNGARVLDASGRVVSPGFIDIHTHSDFTLLADGRGISKALQGVTTEVTGNCGGWAAPLYGEARIYGEGRRDRVGNRFQLSWETMGGYLDRLTESGVSYNVVTLVGHANIRASVVGLQDRLPTLEELQRMQALLAEVVDQGAAGMSTGLFYAPGSYADTDEVVALAEVLHHKGAIYASHIRDEGNNTVGVLTALDEAMEIGRRSGVRVQVSHLEAIGVPSWGKAPEMLRIIEKAVSEGVDVAFDVNPYTTTGTHIDGALTPRWAMEGGRERFLQRLRDPEERKRIEEDYRKTVYENRGGPDRLLVTAFAPNPAVEGKTLDELAGEEGRDPIDVLMSLTERADATLVSYSVSDDDAELIMCHPLAMISSDGLSVAASGPLSAGKQHPCDFGCFPRVMETYCREKRLWPLETAVAMCTGRPAERLGWTQRGTLKEGNYADIVVFEPDTIHDRSTLLEPHQYPSGIDLVIVNGVTIVEGGEHTDARPGIVFRHGDGRA